MLKFDDKGNFTFEYMIDMASKDSACLLDMIGKEELKTLVDGLSYACESFAKNDCLDLSIIENEYRFYSDLYEEIQSLCYGKWFTEENGWLF